MKTLRPYQLEAVEAADSAYATNANNYALIVMATGLGKTVIAAEMARRVLVDNPSANILFMTHRTDILRQARKEFIESCGDLTSTGTISSEETENPDAQVLFITFQSMESRRERYDPRHFQMIIVDEAHHGYAATYHSTLVYFVPKQLFGMTATEERSDGLDIRDIFGEPVYIYPLARAIADGWLAEVDYHILTDNIDLAKLRGYIKAIDGCNRKVTKKHLDTNIFLEERIERQVDIIRAHQHGGKRTAVFCRSAEDLDAFHTLMPEAMPYHSAVSTDERVRILDEFRTGGIQTVLVIDMFNEGIDVPDLELVVFRRATDSISMWFQQLGRGTRLTPQKRRLTALDFVANCDRIIAVKELGLEVMRWGGGAGMQDKIHVPGPGWDIQFTDEIIDLINVLERLQVEHYPNIEEAMAAVSRLQPIPKTVKEYIAACRKDPRLPTNPNHRYAEAWQNYPTFLGTSTSPRPHRAYYPTLQQASKEAIKLGITTKRDYEKRYKENPSLPCDPDRVYVSDWEGWTKFLNTGRSYRRKDVYDTLAEASAAAQSKGIKTYAEYRARYRNDPKLPAQPGQKYPDWQGWPHFLGTISVPGRVKRKRTD